MTGIIAVYREISDQTGTSEVVGLYSTSEAADEAVRLVEARDKRRAWPKAFTLDAPRLRAAR